MNKKTIGTILRIFGTIAFFSLLFWKMRGELSGFVSAVKNADLCWLIPSFILFVSVFMISVFRWRLLLKVHGVHATVWNLTKYYFIGLFFNNFMLGLTGGDLVKAYYVSRETTDKKAEAAITVFIDRIIGMFSIMLIAVVAVLIHFGDPRLGKVTKIIFIMFIIFCAFGLLFLEKDVLRKMPFFKWIYQFLPFKHMIHRFYHAFYIYKDHKKVLLITFCYSLVLQAAMIFITYGIGRSFGVNNVPLINFFLFVPIISTISALPISVGGLGVAESAYVYFFNLIVPQSARYLAMALGLRLVTVVWGLLGGIFCLMPQNKVSEKDLEQIEELEEKA